MPSQQTLTSYYASQPTKRPRSLSESGVSPTNKRHIRASDDITIESQDVPVWANFLGNGLKKVLQRLDRMDDEIKSQINAIKQDYDQRVKSVESAFTEYKKETDQKISTLTSSLKPITEIFDDEKRMNEDLDQ